MSKVLAAFFTADGVAAQAAGADLKIGTGGLLL